MFCKNCGHEVEDNADVCTNCGCFVNEKAKNEVQTTNNADSGSIVKKGWFLAIICFFLGGLGVHRFIVGKIGTGILWLVTFGFLGIGALIDFIMILCSSFTDKEGNKIPLGI